MQDQRVCVKRQSGRKVAWSPLVMMTSGLHGRSVRASQHGVKEVHVCDVSLAGWSRLVCVCLLCEHITGCRAVTDRSSVAAPLKGDTRVASLTTGCPVH